MKLWYRRTSRADFKTQKLLNLTLKIEAEGHRQGQKAGGNHAVGAEKPLLKTFRPPQVAQDMWVYDGRCWRLV